MQKYLIRAAQFHRVSGIKVNIVHLFFLLARSLWSFWFAPFPAPDLFCAKILEFSIETCPFRGDIDAFFLAGVMIWWITISKPRTILAFMLVFCAFVGFCLVVQILISHMNTNIYSASVWAPVTSDAFQLLKSLLEQQVAAPRTQRHVFLSYTRKGFSLLFCFSKDT